MGGAAGILNAANLNTLGNSGPGSGTGVLNFNHNEADYQFTRDGTSTGGAITISQNISVNQIGSGKTTLTGNNSYNGTTTISAGILQIGNGGTSGTLGTGNVVNDATLVFNRSNAMTVANAISGSGGLRQIGTGTTTLTAANTYAGGTLVKQGTLAVDGAGASITHAARSMNVGEDPSDNGRLEILNGADVTNASAALGVPT